MTVPAGIEVTQTVEREFIIRDLVLDLDADIPCQLVESDDLETRCAHPARWRLLFDEVGMWLACDSCKDECLADGGAHFIVGKTTHNVKLIWVDAL